MRLVWRLSRGAGSILDFCTSFTGLAFGEERDRKVCRCVLPSARRSTESSFCACLDHVCGCIYHGYTERKKRALVMFVMGEFH